MEKEKATKSKFDVVFQDYFKKRIEADNESQAAALAEAWAKKDKGRAGKTIVLWVEKA